MAKNLSARIAERKAQTTRQGKNRATFLALQGEVKRAVADGCSVRSVWETLRAEGKVAFSYETFRGYVNRYGSGKRAELRVAGIAKPEPGKHRSAGKTVSVRPSQVDKGPTPNTAGRRFTFNSVPNEEELF